jgi:hypothetical protein
MSDIREMTDVRELDPSELASVEGGDLYWDAMAMYRVALNTYLGQVLAYQVQSPPNDGPH